MLRCPNLAPSAAAKPPLCRDSPPSTAIPASTAAGAAFALGAPSPDACSTWQPWEPSAKACYHRLLARGKPHKVAMIAVMRRLAGLLDTLLREDRLWQTQPPARVLEAAA